MTPGLFRRYRGRGIAWAKVEDASPTTYFSLEGRFVIRAFFRDYRDDRFPSSGYVLFDRVCDTASYVATLDIAKGRAEELCCELWGAYDDEGLDACIESAV